MFDPKQHKTDPNAPKGGGYIPVPGDYILVIRSFQREKARSGKAYLMCTIRCIHGKQSGKKMNERIFLNQESLWKLGKLCESMGYEEPFDLDDLRSVKQAICNRPFKARVKIRQGDSQGFAEIAMFLNRWERDEKEAADQWVAELAASGDGGYDDDDDGASYGGGYGGGGSGGGGKPYNPEDFPDDFNEDDIPF